MPTDPVCGMQVDEKTAAAKAEYQGRMYYFCSHGCHKAFVSNPEKYTASPKSGMEHGPHHGGGGR